MALSTQDQKNLPPKILATGKGHLAEQILEIAFANGIRVREDPDLVQILSSIDIDSEIPVEAFGVVAEILTYLYRLNGTFKPLPNGTFDINQQVDASNWRENSEYK